LAQGWANYTSKNNPKKSKDLLSSSISKEAPLAANLKSIDAENHF
jgi:hypothetical protein